MASNPIPSHCNFSLSFFITHDVCLRRNIFKHSVCVIGWHCCGKGWHIKHNTFLHPLTKSYYCPQAFTLDKSHLPIFHWPSLIHLDVVFSIIRLILSLSLSFWVLELLSFEVGCPFMVPLPMYPFWFLLSSTQLLPLCSLHYHPLHLPLQ